MPSALRTPEVGTALLAHPSAELYGSDRVLLETVSALVEASWRVVLTTPTDGPLLAEARARGAETVVVPVPVLRKSALSALGFARLASDLITTSLPAQRLLGRLRPDVVYVSTVTIPLWSLLARTQGIPLVAHVHEAERAARRIIRRGLASPLVLANRIIVNSRFARDVLTADIARLADTATVVYNGVPGPASVVPPRLALAGSLRAVYVGRISPRKGVDVAVEAIGSLVAQGVDVTLDIVGAVFEGYEWFEQQLRDRVDELGLADRVRFHGFRNSAWSEVALADVVLVPSRTDEPFGNTAVEAVMAARPSVITASGGLPEAVSGFASSILVAPDDSDALADALVQIASEWPTFRELAVADAADARERYSTGRYRADVTGLIEELVLGIQVGVSRSALSVAR